MNDVLWNPVSPRGVRLLPVKQLCAGSYRGASARNDCGDGAVGPVAAGVVTCSVSASTRRPYPDERALDLSTGIVRRGTLGFREATPGDAPDAPVGVHVRTAL